MPVRNRSYAEHSQRSRDAGRRTLAPESGEGVAAGLAYATDLNGVLHILNVSEPKSVSALSSYSPLPWSGATKGVHAIGNLAYLASERGGLHILDVTDPANPLRVGGLESIGFANAVQVIGNLAFVASDQGLQTIQLRGGSGFAPGILAHPQGWETPLGANVALHVSAAGTEPLQYQWRKDGVDLADGLRFSGSRSARLTISNLGTADLGTYSVVVSKSELRLGQHNLVLRISGPPAGATVILSSSVDLINWVPWLTNVDVDGCPRSRGAVGSNGTVSVFPGNAATVRGSRSSFAHDALLP